MKKAKYQISLICAVIIAVVFGFVSGVVGELWVNGFLLPEVQQRSFQDLTKRIEELTEQKNADLKQMLNAQEFSAGAVVEEVQPTIVTFYNYKKPGDTLNSVYLDNQRLGFGFVLTSDGWLVTTRNVLTEQKDYAVKINNEVYQVESYVVDNLTKVVFVKVDADNLPVVDLGSKNTLDLGQSLLVFGANQGVVSTAINDLYFFQVDSVSDLLHSSEQYYRYILLKDSFKNQDLGAPVVSLDGKVIGLLLSADGQVLPIDYFTSVIKSAVQTQQIDRSYLGVNYLDLQTVTNLDTEIEKGAKLSAIKANSPAQSAGLQVNDIIIKVENEEVNNFHSLTELIQDYKPQTSVNLTVVREGEEQEVSVVLQAI